MRGKDRCPPGPRGFGRFAGPFMGRMPWLDGGFGGRFGFGPLLEGLQLEDDQIERLCELKERSGGKFAHARVDMLELHAQLFKEIGSKNIDKKKVADIATKIKEHKSFLTDLMVENMLAFADVLTPEQRRKVRVNRLRQFLGADQPDETEE